MSPAPGWISLTLFMDLWNYYFSNYRSMENQSHFLVDPDIRQRFKSCHCRRSEDESKHCTWGESRMRGRCLSQEMTHQDRCCLKQRVRLQAAHFNFITTQLFFFCATDNKSRGPICRLKGPRFSFKVSYIPLYIDTFTTYVHINIYVFDCLCWNTKVWAASANKSGGKLCWRIQTYWGHSSDKKLEGSKVMQIC